MSGSTSRKFSALEYAHHSKVFLSWQRELFY